MGILEWGANALESRVDLDSVAYVRQRGGKNGILCWATDTHRVRIASATVYGAAHALKIHPEYTRWSRV